MSKRHATPHSSTRLAWLGAGVGTLLALITQAPAYWLTQAVATATADRVLLQEPRGTVWQGSAQWVLHNAPSSAALPTRVQWQIAPAIDWPNARLALRLAISSACCTTQPVQVDVSPLWRGVRVAVNDQTSSWPASWLVGLGAPWNTVQPDGLLQLQTRQLAWSQQSGSQKLQGQAELQLQQLSTRLSTLNPLGTYRLVLNSQLYNGNDTMSVKLDTLDGSLRLQGDGRPQQGRWTFNGEASTAPDAQGALSNLLNILGQRRGDKSILKIG
jgi:general secretion pathway protein N